MGNQQPELLRIDKVMEGILNYDYVRCPMCGKEGKRIYIHLKSVHGMSVTEFNEKYPDYPTTCASLRQQIQKNTKKSLNEPDVVEKRKEFRASPEGHEVYRRNGLAARNNPEYAERQRRGTKEAMERLWADPEWREENSRKIRESLNTERIHALHHNRLVKQWENPEYRKHITEMVCDMVADGKLGVKQEYVDNRGQTCIFRSSWELSVHNILNDLSLEHTYEKDKFFYQLEDGTWRLYLPDFYVEKYHCFLEVKPYVFQSYEINLLKKEDS